MKIRNVLSNPPDRLYHSTIMLVMGKSKSGKTRLSSTVGRYSFNEPCQLLHIDQDNGGGGQKFSNPALIPDTFDEYKQLLELIATAVTHQDGPVYQMAFLNRTWKFNGILVDTLNRLQDMLRKQLKGGSYLSEKRLQIQDFGSMLDDLLGLILTLKELSERKPFHIVLTAQVSPDKVVLRKQQKDSDDTAAAYYWLPSLQGSIGPKLAEHVDIAVTTYRDPISGNFRVFGVDTVTDIGTFSGGLRYLDYLSPKFRPDNLPNTWWDILKAFKVDVDHPENIGALDATVHIEQHWSEITKNRSRLEKLLTDKGIPIEYLFQACFAADWSEMVSYHGTGQDAYKAAKELYEAEKGSNGHQPVEQQPLDNQPVSIMDEEPPF